MAVLPYSAGPRPLPDADFLAKVQAQLESIRPICTRVKAVAPLYIRIHISVTVLTRAGAQDVEAGIRRAVQACFASDENGWRLGDRITEGEIAGAIGQVRGVLGVKTLLMTAESARPGARRQGTSFCRRTRCRSSARWRSTARGREEPWIPILSSTAGATLRAGCS